MLSKTGIKYITKRKSKKRGYFTPPPFNQAKTIGVILNDQSQQDKEVISYIAELKKSHNVEVITFTKNKTDKNTPKDLFSSNDFNWIGKISKKSIHNFTKTSFDFLISLNTSTILYVENILALSQAKCRIGVSNQENYPFLDFMIMTKSSTSWANVIKNIKHYTENIA